ncbi:BEN domain-containing protein 5-like [Anneissia japonica]|uniref:BEN domain-containing protein 5-like n=1 Tax=Anneissia japonica TaxID=1529436 RepID=UPI001425553A|nr:BEN domain-containing protein 5-like [Anneissia japonica]
MAVKKWQLILANKKASMFVKQLVVSVWGSDILANKSVEGKLCPRHKGTGKIAKPALTPKKYNAVRERFIEYLSNSGQTREEIAVESTKFNKFITEKIGDLNRPLKKKLF